MPSQPRQSPEQDCINEIADCVDIQLKSGTWATGGKSSTPLMVIERVKGTDDALNNE